MRETTVISSPLMRAASWICIGLLAVLSLVPAEEMVRTGLPGQLEHFVAYAGTAFISVAAYIKGSRGSRVIGLLAIYAGVLEYLQTFSPGRHAAVADFLFSVAGDVCGGMMMIVLWQINRPPLQPHQARPPAFHRWP